MISDVDNCINLWTQAFYLVTTLAFLFCLKLLFIKFKCLYFNHLNYFFFSELLTHSVHCLRCQESMRQFSSLTLILHLLLITERILSAPQVPASGKENHKTVREIHLASTGDTPNHDIFIIEELSNKRVKALSFKHNLSLENLRLLTRQ